MTDLPSDVEPADRRKREGHSWDRQSIDFEPRRKDDTEEPMMVDMQKAAHPHYANAGQADTRPAGSYAEGSRRAAAETARLQKLAADVQQRGLDDVFVEKIISGYTDEQMLKWDGQMFIAATQIRLLAIIAKRLGEIGGRS